MRTFIIDVVDGSIAGPHDCGTFAFVPLERRAVAHLGLVCLAATFVTSDKVLRPPPPMRTPLQHDLVLDDHVANHTIANLGKLLDPIAEPIV